MQDKAWVHDPDGNEWEVFVVLEDNLAEATSQNDGTCLRSDIHRGRRHQKRTVSCLLLMKRKLIKYKTPIVVTISLVVLQFIWGFDPKFCFINIIWLFVQDYE